MTTPNTIPADQAVLLYIKSQRQPWTVEECRQRHHNLITERTINHVLKSVTVAFIWRRAADRARQITFYKVLFPRNWSEKDITAYCMQHYHSRPVIRYTNRDY